MREVEYEEYVPVKSSAISSVVYNSKTEELYVLFPGGKVAGYKDVSKQTFDDLVHAYSIGRFYTSEIKGQHRGINTEDITFTKAKEVAPSYAQVAQSSAAVVESDTVHDVSKPNYEVTVVCKEHVQVSAANLAGVERAISEMYDEFEIVEVKKIEQGN